MICDSTVHHQRYVRGLAAAVLISALSTAPLGAIEKAPFPHHQQPYELSSGLQRNAGASRQLAFEEIVYAPPGAPWMRVHFAGYRLGPGSYLRLTSLQDGAEQRLDAGSLWQWRDTSAYFNGDAVRVAMHLAPGEDGAFFEVDAITVGEWRGESSRLQPQLRSLGGDESQCGASDDRVGSSDPAVGRIMPIGCTGWIVSNRANLTAGHCISASTDTLQFNVPGSQADGTPVNPPPADQYPIEPVASIDSFNDGPGAIGNDWAVFETFVNANTGRHAVHVQNAYYRMSRDYSPSSVTVTGFGFDWVPAGPVLNSCGIGVSCNSDSQTQQTHSGSYLGEDVQGASDVVIEYTVDTEGGNSGSPVIVPTPATGWPALTMGIHTNAGCNPPTDGNHGTGFEHDNLEAAIHGFHGTSNAIYVDSGHYDLVLEDGSVLQPYDTFTEGVTDAAGTMGTPRLSVVAGTYNEVSGAALVIDDPMLILAPVGDVIIE